MKCASWRCSSAGRKAGDEVTLHLMRAGQPKSVKVKLVQREMPKRLLEERRIGPDFRWFGQAGPGPGVAPFHRGQAARMLHPGGPERVHELLGAIDEARSGNPRVHVFERRGQRRLTPRAKSPSSTPRTARWLFSDDEGSLELTINEGKKLLVAKSPKGDVIFDGPVDTPEQREKMTEALRERLGKIEKMDGSASRPTGTSRGSRVRVIEAAPSAFLCPEFRPVRAPSRCPKAGSWLPKAEPAI
jgi:hypothetical protein